MSQTKFRCPYCWNRVQLETTTEYHRCPKCLTVLDVEKKTFIAGPHATAPENVEEWKHSLRTAARRVLEESADAGLERPQRVVTLYIADRLAAIQHYSRQMDNSFSEAARVARAGFSSVAFREVAQRTLLEFVSPAVHVLEAARMLGGDKGPVSRRTVNRYVRANRLKEAGRGYVDRASLHDFLDSRSRPQHIFGIR